MLLVFEYKTACPKCGATDKELLIEIGQGQRTEWRLQGLELDFVLS